MARQSTANPPTAEQDEHGVRLSGELNAATVPTLLKQVGGWFGGSSAAGSADDLAVDLAVDLAGITRADSAGVALLLEIQRRAGATGRGVAFLHAPEQMQAIIGFCALDQVLALR